MKWYCLVGLFFFSLVTSAQFIDTKSITADNGLISNNIHSVLIDTKGNLLLGSRSGLAIKKGNTYETVLESNQHKFNNIYDILEDPSSGKWIAGYGQGLLYYKDNRSRLLQEKQGLANNIVRTLFYHNNRIYVGTINGISIISDKDFQIVNPKFNQNPNYLFTITSFFRIEDKIYATTLNDGVFLVTQKEIKKVLNLKKALSSIVFENKLYIATDQKLLQLNTSNFKIEKEFNIGNIWKFQPIGKALYFVSSGIYDRKGGLYKLEKQKVQNITEKYKLPFTDLKSITYDKKNDYIFLGTQDNGLIQINLNSPVANLHPFKEIYSIIQHQNQEFIFDSTGLTILENSKAIYKTDSEIFKKFQQIKQSPFQSSATIKKHFYPIDYQTSADKIIYYNSQIYNNSLWVATNIGFYELDLKGKILNYYPIHVFHFSFFKNQLILPVPYAGVRIFNNLTEFKYDCFHDWNNKNIPAEIVSIAQNNEAVFFASALSGLYIYKNEAFISLLENNIFNEAKIKRICTSQDGDLIVVTDFNDVYLLDTKTPNYNIKKHISNEKIKGSTTFFVNEKNGVLYIGTNLGINVFYNDNYFLIDKAQGFTNYNSTNTFATENELLIGTKTDYFSLNHSYFTKNRDAVCKAVINKIYVNNDLVDFRNSTALTLESKENNIRILISVPNAKYPDKLTFKYRLKPTESWQNITNENQLILNYLNSGNYHIQLQISDLDTGKITTQSLLKITIKPPFYYNLNFIIGFIIFLLSLSYLGYKFRIDYLKKKQIRDLAFIELQNEQEKKELLFDKQLADIKLQALKSQMNSHFIFNVLSSIQYFIICKDVNNALYYLEQFSKLIRTTLKYSDYKHITLYEEIAYLKQYLEIENLRAENQIVFTEHIDDLIDITRIKIIPLLLQPFIENSIVHAFPSQIKNPKIDLFIKEENDSIIITLIDNGIGYQDKKITTHQSKGISIIQKQLKLTQQKLQVPIEIMSSEKGTKIKITLITY